MKGQLTAESLPHFPGIEQRILQSLRRDASERGKSYLDSAADLIEILMARPAPVVVCLRHPDFGNEYQVFGGDVEIIDVDEGGSFDVAHLGPHSPDYEVEEVLMWAEEHTRVLLTLDNVEAQQAVGVLVGQVLQILRTGSC